MANGQLSIEAQMFNEYTNKCLNLVAKMTLKFQLTPIRVDILKKTITNAGEDVGKS
jgi:hypothetical protein